MKRKETLRERFAQESMMNSVMIQPTTPHIGHTLIKFTECGSTLDCPGHLASTLYIWMFEFSLSLCTSFEKISVKNRWKENSSQKLVKVWHCGIRYEQKCNIVFVLIQDEETKFNNHNANDHETAHADTFSWQLVPVCLLICWWLSLLVHYNSRIKGIVTGKVWLH